MGKRVGSGGDGGQPPLLPEGGWDEPASRKERLEAALDAWDEGALLEGFAAYLGRAGVQKPDYYLWTVRNLVAWLALRDRRWPALEAGDLEAFLQEWLERGPPLGGKARRPSPGSTAQPSRSPSSPQEHGPRPSRRGSSPGSARKAYAGLNHFARFLEWGGVEWPPHLRFPDIPPHAPQRDGLSEGEFARLLEAARAHPAPPWRTFLEAALWLLAEGVRVGEVHTLRTDDLAPSRRRLRVRGRRGREIPLAAETAAALSRWLEEREALAALHPFPFPQLFLRPRRWRGDSQGRPVSRTAFVEALHALFDLAGVAGPPGPRLLWWAVRRLLGQGLAPAEVARRVAMVSLPAILRGEA